MSKIRLQWLWIVVGIELLAILALIVWAVAVRQPEKPTTKQTPTQQKQVMPNYKTPVIDLVRIVSGLAEPVAIASMPNPGDKRLFVLEQAGTIRVVTAERQLDPTPLLDIKSKVQSSGEMGLLGIAFHPKVAENNFFFINYIDKNSNTIIARYTIGKNGQADKNSEKVLLKLKQPYSNHNGGALAFGPDGYLYIGMGDGGSAGDPQNRAQNPDELLGKMLRIDVDKGVAYDIPADNPFATGGGKPEIWAMGLRNPWRFSFDAKNGDLYIADVGQGNYEEVSLQASTSKGGENYGWRCYEGAQPFNTADCKDAKTYVKPILQYDHGEERCSVTGGHVYRGTAYPALDGQYFYGDFCNGQLFYATKGTTDWQPTLAKATGLQISTFGEDSSRELYVADYAQGTVYQIIDTANPAQ